MHCTTVHTSQRTSLTRPAQIAANPGTQVHTREVSTIVPHYTDTHEDYKGSNGYRVRNIVSIKNDGSQSKITSSANQAEAHHDPLPGEKLMPPIPRDADPQLSNHGDLSHGSAKLRRVGAALRAGLLLCFQRGHLIGGVCTMQNRNNRVLGPGLYAGQPTWRKC